MTTVSKISFDGSSFKNDSLSERHRKRPILSGIARMSDEEIIGASVRNANKEAEKSTAAGVLKKGPLLFVAAMPVVYGALTKGKLSDKAASAAKTLGVMAGAYALSKPFNSFEERIENKSDNVKKFNNEHPIASAVVSTAAFVAGAALLLGAGKKAGLKLADKFKPAADSIKRSIVKCSEKIDNSASGKLTEKISAKVSEFTSKYPKLSKAASIMATVLPVAGFMGGTLTLANKVADDRDEKALSNINKLTLMREYAKAALGDNGLSDDKSDISDKDDD